MKMVATLVFAASLASAGAAAEQANPIGKVLQLISDLQTKVIGEGETSQKVYESFSEWCEESNKNLAFEIHWLMPHRRHLGGPRYLYLLCVAVEAFWCCATTWEAKAALKKVPVGPSWGPLWCLLGALGPHGQSSRVLGSFGAL